MKLTPEQIAIVNHVVAGRNLIVQAYAGTAKTTSLTAAAQALSKSDHGRRQKLLVAFNVRAKDELMERMRGYDDWDIRTFNGLGMGTLYSNAGIFNKGKLVVNEKKVETLVNGAIGTLAKTNRVIPLHAMRSMGKDRLKAALTRALPDCEETRNFLGEAVTQCKIWGIKPHAFKMEASGKLETDEDRTTLQAVFDKIPYSDWLPKSNTDHVVNSILSVNLSIAKNEGVIDFNDQIYLSVLFCPNPGKKWPVILADEIQDMSALNNAQIERVGYGQKVGVGDKNQAIYLFRGATPGNMEVLREAWKADTLNLSVTFRCPRAVVERAKRTIGVTDYKAHEKNREGYTQFPFISRIYMARMDNSAGIKTNIVCASWKPSDILRGHLRKLRDNPNHRTLVLARKNAGCIIFLGLMMLDRCMTDNFHMGHIGWAANSPYLPHSMTNAKPEARLMAQILQYTGTSQAEFQNLLAPTVDGENYNFCISTGHRWKGLEADDVYIWDPYSMNMETNLYYVCQTRARNKLAFLLPNMYGGEAASEPWLSGALELRPTPLMECLDLWQDEDPAKRGVTDFTKRQMAEVLASTAAGREGARLGCFWSYDRTWLEIEKNNRNEPGLDMSQAD